MIQVEDSPKGVVVSFRTEKLFEPGSAAINPAQAEILDAAGELLQRTANTILIMGRAGGDKPKSVALQSNWELSLHRAFHVMYYLTANFNMGSDRFAIGGMGDLDRQISNDSPDRDDRSDRIDFILMGKKI